MLRILNWPDIRRIKKPDSWLDIRVMADIPTIFLPYRKPFQRLNKNLTSHQLIICCRYKSSSNTVVSFWPLLIKTQPRIVPDLLPFPSQIRLADSCIRLDTGNKNVHPLQSWSFYNETVSSVSSDIFLLDLVLALSG